MASASFSWPEARNHDLRFDEPWDETCVELVFQGVGTSKVFSRHGQVLSSSCLFSFLVLFFFGMEKLNEFLLIVLRVVNLDKKASSYIFKVE